jgi:hypothetical protein
MNCKKNEISLASDRTWRYKLALFKEHRDVQKKTEMVELE